MKNGAKHHLEMKKPSTSPSWGGHLHLHVTENVDKMGKSSTSYFTVGTASSRTNPGYANMVIPEDQLLPLAFFLFDIAEKNGLVPSAENAELKGDPVAAAPAVVEAEVENPKGKKIKSNKISRS